MLLLLPLLAAETAGLEGALSGGGGGGGSAADMMFRLRHPLLPEAGIRRPRPGWLRLNELMEDRTNAFCTAAPGRA